MEAPAARFEISVARMCSLSLSSVGCKRLLPREQVDAAFPDKLHIQLSPHTVRFSFMLPKLPSL